MTLHFEIERPEDPVMKQFSPFSPEETARRVIESVLDGISCPYETEISLLITGEEEVHELNLNFRGIDRSTDVLSFPLLTFPEAGDFSFLENADEESVSECFNPESGELVLGDIVINAPRCAAQAEEFGHSVLREYAFLIAHSVLHLCGYDHMDPDGEAQMIRLQEDALARLMIFRTPQ